MIRKMSEKDITSVLHLWLDTNIHAHSFINEQYWYQHLKGVEEAIQQAEVYVAEDEECISGFIGLDDNYIAGIFVSKTKQSQGIGKKLLDHAKVLKKTLSLSVYQKNKKATNFYLRESFIIQCERIDSNTHEKEYVMRWNNG